MGFIYKIINKVNNKCYIGETVKENPLSRWNQHKNCAIHNIGCPAIKGAIQKYGIENFTFDIIIICFDEDRFKYEKEYILKYNSLAPNGYNLTLGGEGGGFQGKKHTEETKNKISEKLKGANHPNYGKKINVEVINKREHTKKERYGGSNNKGVKLTPEQRQRRIDAMTDERKDKIRQSLLKYYANKNSNKPSNKHKSIDRITNSKIVEQYDINGNKIQSYASMTQAGKQLNILSSGISRSCITGKIYGGYYWKITV